MIVDKHRLLNWMFDMSESDNNSNIISAIAYVWFLFWLPLVVNPTDSFSRYHANQATILFLVSFVGNIVLTIIPIIGWMLLPFFNIGCFVFMVLGMINAYKGNEKPLPIIGNYTLIK